MTTATARRALVQIAHRLENLEDANDRNWERDRYVFPGIDERVYKLNRAYQTIVGAAFEIRTLLSREPGAADVAAPPASVTVEHLLCHQDGCGRPIVEERLGPGGSWVRKCPVHGADYL